MPQRPLDDADHRILAELQRDGRATNVEIAARTHQSESPCLRRIRRLEEEGVITGYRATLDRGRLGLGLTVFVSIKVDRHTRRNADALARALDRIPEVITCHMVSGSADFLAEVAVRDLDAYETLLTQTLLELPMVEDIQSVFSLRPVKTDARLPLP